MPAKLLTASQTAERLGVSVATVRRLAYAGTLRPVKLGPRAWLRFRVEDVEQLAERGMVAA